MKKIMMAAMAVALASVAGAQSVEFDNGVYAVQGCYQTKDGVRCDLMFTPAHDYSGYILRDWFQAVTVDGATVEASAMSAAGSSFNKGNGIDLRFYKGAPVKVSVLFPVSASATSLRVVGIAGKGINNVAVRGAAAPAPVAAPTTLNIAGNWNATLTNCKQTSPGVVVCTATLKK